MVDQGSYLHSFHDYFLYRDFTQFLPLGCPLSPLLGALYLKPLDERLAGADLFYSRFMDDWVTRSVAPTRWKLQAALKVEQLPYKTFIGRISRGFASWGFNPLQ